jgi:hypothetical protein
MLCNPNYHNSPPNQKLNISGAPLSSMKSSMNFRHSTLHYSTNHYSMNLLSNRNSLSNRRLQSNHQLG